MGKQIVLIGAVLAAILAIAAVALAASPVKGKRYSGHLSRSASETITFKVSASGKRVTKVRLRPSIPTKCSSGGPPPAETSSPAKIKQGRFTAKVTTKTSSGKVTATARVTGKFLAKGKEKGVVKVSLPAAPDCNGSFSYSTKASK